MQKQWHAVNRSNLWIIGTKEREGSQVNVIDKIFKRITEENILQLKKAIAIKRKETHRTPTYQDLKRYSSLYAIGKTINIHKKRGLLTSLRQNPQATFKGKPIRIKVNFSMQALETRSDWSNVFQVLKDHRCQANLFPLTSKDRCYIRMKGWKKLFQTSKTRNYTGLVSNICQNRFQTKINQKRKRTFYAEKENN